jgi:ElaB/YqjD/DUF883 family membrane-anchored ribosome-binding protein
MRPERLSDNLAAFRDHVQHRWGKLTKQDVAGVDLDASSLATVLARRYSMPNKEARQQADEFFHGLGTSLSEAAQVVGEAAGDLWRNSRQHVADVVNQGTEKVTDLWQSGRDRTDVLRRRAEKMVAQRPLTSLAIAAGAGALLMMWLRRR